MRTHEQHEFRRPLRSPPRWRWRDLLAALATSALAALTVSVPSAAATTFDHWPGNIAANYHYNGKVFPKGVSNLIPTAEKVDKSFLPPAPVGNTIEQLWQRPSTGPAVCNHIHAEAATLFSLADWRSCSLPASGDVQGELEAPNVLGVNFLLNPVVLQFDLNDPHGTASVVATLGVDFHVDLDFASTVDGASKSTTAALSIGSSSVRVVSVKLEVSQFGVTQAKVAPYAGEIASLVINNVAGWVGLPAAIGQESKSIESGAHVIWSSFVEPSYPDANQVFNLSIGVSRSNLTLTYGRWSLEAAPTGCSLYPDGGPTGGGVEAICAAIQPRGVKTLLLQDYTNGRWTDNPLDSAYEVGTGAGPEWAFLNPFYGWNPNNGPDSDFAPVLVDYPNTTNTTVQMRACSSNEWGLTCDPPVTVTGYTAGATSGGSGGGGGGNGGTTPIGPKPPIQQRPE